MALICIEGMDASGKHTQATRLSEHLRARLISFPTYDTEQASVVGPTITDHLHGEWEVVKCAEEHLALRLGAADLKLDALVFQCVMSVNKYEMAPLIKIRTDYGEVVVLDRYWQSGYAFGGADGLDAGWLVNIHRALPQPDINILLDIDFATSLARRPERRDRYEKMGEEYFLKVRANYMSLWRMGAAALKLPGRWVVLDGTRPADEITDTIFDLVWSIP